MRSGEEVMERLNIQGKAEKKSGLEGIHRLRGLTKALWSLTSDYTAWYRCGDNQRIQTEWK